MSQMVQLQALVKLAKHGSFVRAAEAMDLSVSSLSRHIAALEQRLGVQLVIRTTRSVQLTQSGLSYFEQISTILEDLDRADELVRCSSNVAQGVLKVWAPATISRALLLPALSTFLHEYPNIGLRLRMSDAAPDMFDELEDVCITAGLPDRPDWLVRKLRENHRIVVAAPAYLDRFGVPASPQDLRQHTCLLMPNIPGHDRWDLTSSDARESVTVAGRIKASTSDTLIFMAKEGLGIALLSIVMVGRAVEDGSLVRILPSWYQDDCDLYVAVPPQRYRSLRCRLFVDHLERTMRTEACIGASGQANILSKVVPMPVR